MNYLPIQASAVLCEHIFSSSSETDTKKHNQFSPLLMEVLQMLKFTQKQNCVNFTNGWITSQKDMACVKPEVTSLIASSIWSRSRRGIQLQTTWIFCDITPSLAPWYLDYVLYYSMRFDVLESLREIFKLSRRIVKSIEVHFIPQLSTWTLSRVIGCTVHVVKCKCRFVTFFVPASSLRVITIWKWTD